MSSTVISFAEQFSPTPAGRYEDDGPCSGAKFRDTYLLPALRGGSQPITVDLDGTAGFGSSFLEEAFGGLVRQGFDAATLRRRLTIRSSRPSYLNRVWSYIDHGNDGR